MAEAPASVPRARLRVGIVGCGEVTRDKHLPALRRVPTMDVVALADRDPVALHQVAIRFGIAHRYAGIDAMLQHSGIDAVGVCVPPGEHAPVALTALNARKHVLIEKPLALSLEEAEVLASAATTAPTITLMGFHMRWHRLVQQARALLRRGAIGAVESIHSVWNSPRDDVDLPSWRRRRSEGGGALVEIAVHHVDLWRYLLDTEVELVYAQVRHGQRDDEAATIVARLVNGALASGSFSERSSHQVTIEIAGSAGRLRVDCLRFDGLEVLPITAVPGSAGTRIARLVHSVKELPAGVRASRIGADYLASYRSEWAHLADAAHGRLPPIVTPGDGLQALRIVLAATESAASGRPVAVAQAPRGIVPAREG